MPEIATSNQRDLVSQLAYQLWEQEGRPSDRADLHWFQAEAIISSNGVAKKPVKKSPARSTKRKPIV